MNGMHDLGGMDGFGPVVRDDHTPEGWELRAQSLSYAARAAGLFNLDEFRHAIERLHPADYLRLDYQERRIAAMARLAIEKGVLTAEEIERRAAAFAADPSAAVTRREDPQRVARAFAWRERPGAGRAAERDVPRRFRPGDAVVVRNTHPRGHTRAPRYIRGKRGIVVHHYGARLLPDAHAHGGREVYEPLYAVRFSAREVWGQDYPANDTIHVDLWESYLRPCER
jgi:nitrile hydratase